MARENDKKVLIIGGGAAGQRAAVDLCEAGADVILLEREDSIGGITAGLGTMFPKHNCLLCRGDERHGAGCTRPGISEMLQDYSRPDNLRILTRSRLTGIESVPDTPGSPIKAELVTAPRFIDPERCILCGRCTEVCPQVITDTSNGGPVERKAAYLPAERCIPESYAVEKGGYCENCGECEKICPTDAVDLEQKERRETIEFDAVILATGMELYDPSLSGEYGYGRFHNVVSGYEMERMLSPAGPSEGEALRPSDGAVPESIAWLQCVGSRDEEHDYCSAFCCGYATRQAVLARRYYPDVHARIFMMDDRVFARNFSAVYDPLRREHDIALEHCRVSVLTQDAEDNIILQVTDEDGTVREEVFSMAVLSIGGEAARQSAELAGMFGLTADKHGFIRTATLNPVDTESPGVFIAGNAAGPADLADSVTGGSAAAARVSSYLGLTGMGQGPDSGETAAGDNLPSENDGVSAGNSASEGVFVCDCAGEIGGAVDLPNLTEKLSKLDEVTRAEVVPYGCLPEGIAAIQRAIEKEKLSSVVIGACKRRTYGPLFANNLPVPVRFVSLREECAYVHGGDKAGAAAKAEAMLRRQIDFARRQRTGGGDESLGIEPPKRALVVGAGLAGLTAAKHIADSGFDVDLVEREAAAGGNALRLNLTPEGEYLPGVVRDVAEQAAGHPKINLYLNTEVIRQVSDNGTITASLKQSFDGKISGGGETRGWSARYGAALVATGGGEYRGGVFGLGKIDNVITLLDYGERLREDPKFIDGVKRLVFIGCVGPWNEEGASTPWRCSRNCCETMIRQAKKVREQNPNVQVTVLIREVNTYAFREEEYTAARKAGVLFVRYLPERQPVVTEHDGGVLIDVYDKNLGDTLTFTPDLTVLSAAVLPRADAAAAAEVMQIPLDDDGFYTEWESKTRSYSALEPGVSLAGLAHGPKPVREVITQALAAAQNTVVSLRNPRKVNAASIAAVDPGDCAGCLTCVRTCPYAVPRIGSPGMEGQSKQGKAYIDPFRCQGCGACISECPAGAISLGEFGDGDLNLSAMFGAEPVAAAGDEKSPDITVFSCRYCGNIPIELAGTGRHGYPAGVRIIDVPCTGFLTAANLLSALEQGADGVLVHACPDGTCHHLTGNTRASKRISAVRAVMQAAGIGEDRLRFADFGIGHGKTFAEYVSDFSDVLKNPGLEKKSLPRESENRV